MYQIFILNENSQIWPRFSFVVDILWNYDTSNAGNYSMVHVYFHELWFLDSGIRR